MICASCLYPLIFSFSISLFLLSLHQKKGFYVEYFLEDILSERDWNLRLELFKIYFKLHDNDIFSRLHISFFSDPCDARVNCLCPKSYPCARAKVIPKRLFFNSSQMILLFCFPRNYFIIIVEFSNQHTNINIEQSMVNIQPRALSCFFGLNFLKAAQETCHLFSVPITTHTNIKFSTKACLQASPFKSPQQPSM